MAKNWTKETIPMVIINNAVDWAANFVKKTNWMSAVESMGNFKIGDTEVFMTVRDICRIFGNYNAMAGIIISMMRDKNATENDINVVWNILSNYADPVDIQKFHRTKVQ